MKIVILKPLYTYGHPHVFLNGSICSIAARLLAMGHEVDMLDLNIDPLHSAHAAQLLQKVHVVGVALTGAPDIPGVRELLPTLKQQAPSARLLLGGQVIEHLSVEHFATIFGNEVVQICGDEDLAHALGCRVADIPSPNDVSFAPVWERMGEQRMRMYMQREMTLVVSQGCHYSCKFCAAAKIQRESFRDLNLFETDLRWFADAAKRFGLSTLDFYASSLDFFQNPRPVAERLHVLARVQKETGIQMRTRCLSSIPSFIEAAQKINNLHQLLKEAGLWCVGFGADGTDPSVWRAQGKTQNREPDLLKCLELSDELGIRAELLMVLGFPEDTVVTLTKTLLTSVAAVARGGDVIIRPYLAKPFVPGNVLWAKGGDSVETLVAHPELFQYLDFAALGSTLTHPRRGHRWACNSAYLGLIALLTPVGKCTTSPLLPEAGHGLRGKVAKLVNRHMPFDR